jgi:hypothetical protein
MVCSVARTVLTVRRTPAARRKVSWGLAVPRRPRVRASLAGYKTARRIGRLLIRCRSEPYIVTTHFPRHDERRSIRVLVVQQTSEAGCKMSTRNTVCSPLLGRTTSFSDNAQPGSLFESHLRCTSSPTDRQPHKKPTYQHHPVRKHDRYCAWSVSPKESMQLFNLSCLA